MHFALVDEQTKEPLPVEVAQKFMLTGDFVEWETPLIRDLGWKDDGRERRTYFLEMAYNYLVSFTTMEVDEAQYFRIDRTWEAFAQGKDIFGEQIYAQMDKEQADNQEEREAENEST